MAQKTLRPTRASRIASFFIDALCLAFVATTFNFISTPIALTFPSSKEVVENLNASQKDLVDIIESSHLNTMTEENRFYSLNQLAEDYVYSLAKGSLIFHGAKEEELSSIYENIPVIHEGNDRAYAYYVSFKPERLSSYDEPGAYGVTDYLEKLTDGFEEKFVKEGYPFLTLGATTLLDEGLRDSSFEQGAKFANDLKKHYVEILNEGAKDLSHHYLPYLEKESIYAKWKTDYQLLQVGCALVSSSLALLVLMFLIPLFTEGTTFGEKAMKLRRVDHLEETPTKARIALHRAFFPLFLPMVAIFPALLTPGYGIALLSLPLMGPISVLTLAIISLCLLLCDYLFSFFFTKDTGFELLSRTHLALKEEPHGDRS